jgi:hypothetical protein
MLLYHHEKLDARSSCSIHTISRQMIHKIHQAIDHKHITTPFNKSLISWSYFQIHISHSQLLPPPNGHNLIAQCYYHRPTFYRTHFHSPAHTARLLHFQILWVVFLGHLRTHHHILLNSCHVNDPLPHQRRFGRQTPHWNQIQNTCFHLLHSYRHLPILSIKKIALMLRGGWSFMCIGM